MRLHCSDETPEPGHTLRLDADTLAYTGEGLKTREDLVLRVGQHNRVGVVRPTRARAVSGAYGGFAVGESFPLCAAPVVDLRARDLGLYPRSR